MSEKSLLPIRIKTLRPDIPLGFDVYIQLPNKFVKYFKAEHSIENQQLLKFKDKNVRKLFIEDTQETLYQQYIDQCLASVCDDPNLDNSVKADIVTDAACYNSESIMNDRASEASYQMAKKTTENLDKIAVGNEEVLKEILTKLEDVSDNRSRIIAHSVKTTLLAIGFARSRNFTDEEVSKLGVASLYHDASFSDYSEADQESFFMKIEDLDSTKRQSYFNHPQKCIEKLQDRPYVDKEILELIITHEENISGTGFPKGTKELSGLQQVHSLCCYYDRLITCLGMSSSDAYKEINLNQIGNYPLELLKKFKSYVKKNYKNLVAND